MQITRKTLAPTKTELTIQADQAFLERVKEQVLSDLAKQVNLAGFRKGHAPAGLVEKNVDQATLQSQFLDHAINDLYVEAATEEQLRPASQPAVSIIKFVPFTTLEFKAVVEVVGPITLPDYKKIKLVKKIVSATDKDVTTVLDDLRRRDSEKKDVARPAQDGDEVIIDFTGVDATTKQAIAGATGTDYPLVLGSGSFIPGFEPELIGLKPNANKTFDVRFPKDYSATDLQGKRVSFTVSVKAIKEFQLPKLDDGFAATVGPFKTLGELKADVKKQLQAEKDSQAQRTFETELLAEIAEKSKVAIPKVLIDEEIDRMEAEERRNLVYRGQTWEEHLAFEGKNDEQHREGLRDSAAARVKTGLVLGEISQAEKITVSQAELDTRIAELKRQYTDPQMQAELTKPENRRELSSRIITEKTIGVLTKYAQ